MPPNKLQHADSLIGSPVCKALENTRMNEEVKENELSLSPVSRRIVACVSVLFGLMMLLWAQGQEAWKFTPALFCFIIAGACVLPQPIKGWCGNIIAVVIIALAMGFFYADHLDPQPDHSPVRFALVFGLPAIAYLVNKYGRLFSSKQT